MQQFINLISPLPSYLFIDFFSIYFVLGIAISVYIFFAYCIERIGRKAGVSNTWRAYIPFVNILFLYEIARISYAWFFLSLVPFLNFLIPPGSGVVVRLLGIVSLANLAVGVYMWMRISERLGKPTWFGLLNIVPIANMILAIYLAFSKTTTNEIPTGGSAYQPIVNNWKHPELQEGESFLGNYTQSDFESKIRWQVKRIGNVAYDRSGHILAQQESHPVFVSKEELQKAGIRVE